MMIASCKYDPDAVCGPNQSIGQEDLCYCDAGFTLKNGVCTANAGGTGGAPMGGSGGGGDGDDAGAGELGGQGAACSTDADCTDEAFGKCITMNASSGYCSNTGCSGDCEAGYFCATDASPSYCKRLPTGEDAPCTTSADCAAYDASYCTQNPTTMTSSCVVPGCADGGCSPNFSSCFDLSMYVPNAPKICVPPG